ncbi:MAG: PIN domain-containing protein [Thermomicrobiales bacterium]
MAAEGFVDANVILRYLLNDLPDQARAAAQILDRDVELLVTGGTLAEVAYVLARQSGIAREQVVDALIAFVSKRNITLHALDKALTIQGLLRCRPSGRVSFADALLWASARSAGTTAVLHLRRGASRPIA